MLPTAVTQEQYNAVDLKNPRFVELAKTIYSRLNKEINTTSFPDSGSSPVVFVNDTAIKFFAPVFFDAFNTEKKALKFLSVNKSLVPKIIDVGEVEGWQYIQMTKLAGQSLKDSWQELSIENRQICCRYVGQEIKKIHDLDLSSQDFDIQSWQTFLETQKHNCYIRHEKIGLREDLLKQIPSFLEQTNLNFKRISFLHTELMKDHVFFEEFSGKVSFNGFIDFEPSMVGAPEYDFASVGVFLSSGDSGALRAFFEGYGNVDLASSKDFRRRIMAYTLLHKYSNLKWYLQFMPNADSLEDLADLWWAI